MQKVIVAFGIVMTMLAGAALAEDGAGQAPCGRGKVGCFSAPYSQPQILKQQDQQFSADSSCRVAGTTWEAQDGGIFEIEADLTGTFRYPSCKKPFPFVVTLVGNRLTFHAATGDPKECQGFYEDVTIDSSCNVATGKWTNDDGSSGPDTWYRQGITLSRLDLTRYKASGTPYNERGKFKWTVVPMPGVKPPKVHFDVGNDVYYTKFDNPSGVVLTDPLGNTGTPTPGGLFLLDGTYFWKIGKTVYRDTDYIVGATFGMSCYHTALESEWGNPLEDNCKTFTTGKPPNKVTYSGVYTPDDMMEKYKYQTDSAYCQAFIESVRIEGFGRLDRTIPTKYLAYTSAAGKMWLADKVVGSFSNELTPEKSVARDITIIPQNGTLINVNWIGREPGRAGIGLSADDVGKDIKGYRLDWYGGSGKVTCELPPPAGKKKPVGFKNPRTVGACTREQKVGEDVTCPSDSPTTSSQGRLAEAGFLLSPPFKHVDSRTALTDFGAAAVFVKNNEIVISTETAEQLQLTHNRIPKDFPVWSKDGSKIAFIEKTNRNTALSRLRVISRGGTSLFSSLIHPVPSDPRVAVFGMRFVERVEWISDSKIAVSGSINPSTCENVVFDLYTPSTSDNFFDDECNAAYSHDGLHAAYITGSPHFSPESSRERELTVNGRRVFPERGTQVKFITDPMWNKDSQTLAIVATEEKTKTSNIVMWRSKGEPTIIPFPMEEEAFRNGKADLFWNGQDLVLTSGQQAWLVSQGSLEGINLTLAVNPKQDATKIKRELAASLPDHAEQPDFWCPSCALSSLTRRSSVYDE